MNRLAPIAALGLVAAMPAQAQDWQLLPAIGSDYKAQPTFALTAGTQDYDDGDSGGVYGVELGLACPTLKPPQGRIRQQISLTRYDEDGLETTSLEVNPHYMVDLASNLAVGFGPGLGYVQADTSVGDDGVFALQAGTSLHYRTGPLFLGAEARYQWTQSADFGGGSHDMDNIRLQGKVGVAF